MAEGNLNAQSSDIDRDIASMADFWDMKELDISGESGDVVIATKYTGCVLKEIINEGGSVATVIVQTVRTPATSITLKIAANGGRSGRLPSIYSITKSGSSDDLVLLLQKM